MHPVEIKKVLSSLEILVDNREQDTERARRRYSAFGVPFQRATLSYGDYSYNAVLPDGSKLMDPEHTLEPKCVVERKMNLDELAGCFTNSRERFEREFKRAKEHDCRIYLLVENASWENLLNGKYRSLFNPNAFTGSVTAWMVRYNMNLIFCKEETSSRLIKEICYRDLKERLERGDYG
jgi:ERCC4-type nuclease